ncbi:MAG: hypothetical protein FJ279_18885, partial [Planctomycetes bacterium]|nr:hypothetical protein [Planctomycetota bacterium]
MVLRGLRLLAACVGLSWSYVASAGVIEFDFSPPLLERIEARGKAKRTLLTVPACQAAPKVDGDGGDAAWASAAQIGQLARGGSMNTTVRLCHDG